MRGLPWKVALIYEGRAEGCRHKNIILKRRQERTLFVFDCENINTNINGQPSLQLDIHKNVLSDELLSKKRFEAVQ